MKINNFSYQKNFKSNGVEYDLSHLKPIALTMNINNKDISIEVKFSTHTFTIEYDSKIHRPDLIIDDETNIDRNRHHKRAFDLTRYKLSLELFNIFNEITPNTKTHYTGRGNFIVRNKDYYVFFRMYRKGDIANIYVKSAYKKRKKVSGNVKNIKKCLMDKGF